MRRRGKSMTFEERKEQVKRAREVKARDAADAALRTDKAKKRHSYAGATATVSRNALKEAEALAVEDDVRAWAAAVLRLSKHAEPALADEMADVVGTTTAAALRDGRALCEILRVLKGDEAVKRVFGREARPLQHLENINLFLRGCRNELGIADVQLFAPIDLYEAKNVARVVQTLDVVRHVARDEDLVPAGSVPAVSTPTLKDRHGASPGGGAPSARARRPAASAPLRKQVPKPQPRAVTAKEEEPAPPAAQKEKAPLSPAATAATTKAYSSDSDADVEYEIEYVSESRFYDEHPIQDVAAMGLVPQLRMRRKRGDDLDEADEYGFTSLHISASYGRIKVVRYLLKHGADTTLLNEEGETAQSLARNDETLECFLAHALKAEKK